MNMRNYLKYHGIATFHFFFEPDSVIQSFHCNISTTILLPFYGREDLEPLELY
jgi:hypothetical protein